MDFTPANYGPAVAEVIGAARLNELGPGTANAALRPALERLTPESLAAPHAVADREMALACLAGLWLRHDFLDESHQISQEIDSPTGSYWHAIMHRREPDFSNAKYWFRRVGRHAVYRRLATSARRLAAENPAGPRAAAFFAGEEWNAAGFVDLCQTALDDSSPLTTLCRKVQQCEWTLLFDDCYRRATGG